MWNAIAQQTPGEDNVRDKLTFPEDDDDPFIKYGHVLSVVRGIWSYGAGNSNANMVGLLGVQIQHEFIYDLISSSLQDERAKNTTRFKLYHTDGKDVHCLHGLCNSMETIEISDEHFAALEDGQVHELRYDEENYLCKLQDLRVQEDYLIFSGNQYKIVFCNKYPEDYAKMMMLRQDQDRQFGVSHWLLFFMALMTFAIIFCSIMKFARQVTEPITKLTEYTQEYRQKQTMEQKNAVIDEMKDAELFRDTKKQLRKEDYIMECYRNRPQRRQTINIRAKGALRSTSSATNLKR